MKSFDSKEILKTPKYLMDLVGIWPESSPNIGYKLYTVMVFMGVFLLTIFAFVKSVEDFRSGKMETGCFGMCLVLASGHAAFKIWFLQINKPKFLKIIDALNDPCLTSHEDRFDVIFQNKLILSSRVRNFYFTASFISVTSSSLSHIQEDYSLTPGDLPFRADINNLPKFISIWIFALFSNYYTFYIIAAYEGFIFTLLSMGNVQLEILAKQIECALDDLPPRSDNLEEMKKIDSSANALLSKCVLRHNAIERYIEAVEDKFSMGFLVQLLLTLMVTGLIGFYIVFASKDSADLSKCVSYFIGDMCQAAILCFPCNEIILQGQYIGTACYMSNWDRCGTSVAKTLMLIMERSKRPLGLTAGKFTMISIKTFIAILNTSMSYFTVLRNFYMNKHKQ